MRVSLTVFQMPASKDSDVVDHARRLWTIKAQVAPMRIVHWRISAGADPKLDERILSRGGAHTCPSNGVSNASLKRF